MIMSQSYLFDLREEIRNTSEEVFQNAGLSRKAVLNNKKELERLWFLYQKSIEDYGCDPWYAYGDALKTVYHIDYMPVPKI